MPFCHKCYYREKKNEIKEYHKRYYKANREYLLEKENNNYIKKKMVNFGTVLGKPQEIKLKLNFDE